MLTVFAFLNRFLAQALPQDDCGATAVEYGLMVALIATVIVGAVALFGAAVNGLFTTALSSF